MSIFISILAFAVLTPEAPFDPFTESTAAKANPISSRYQDCIALVEGEIEIGRIAAKQWTAEGGGVPALHCEAIADLRAGFPKLAAVRLTQLSARSDAGDGLVRARYLEQAAIAWLEADELEHASDTIRQAQVLAPNSGELSLTAGLIFAAKERWRATIEAISAAEAEGFKNTAGLVARGKAYKALANYRRAAEDTVAALSIDPFSLDALVLRGELQQLGIAIDANYQRSAN